MPTAVPFFQLKQQNRRGFWRSQGISFLDHHNAFITSELFPRLRMTPPISDL